MARTIHGASPRAGKPFIEVNCTALPATLMEAELFGHERGAFTDAKESRMGLFEAADGGFLFLDEVGDVELSLQGKLLKAVEERTVRRVGGIRDRRIDVRILAATNRDLERDAQRDQLPPRPLLPAGGDHPPPAAAARARRATSCCWPSTTSSVSTPSTARQVRQIDPRARDLMLAYPWPGNVRELSHVIERAVLWSRGPTLDAEHLSLVTPLESVAGAGEPGGSAGAPPAAPARHRPRSTTGEARAAPAGDGPRAAGSGR